MAVRLLGVTILTSITPDEIAGAWGREILSIRDEVGRLAELAQSVGMDGVVASALEASWIRSQLGPDLVVVTPGIRPVENRPADDQKRIVDVAQAFRGGADYIVVGRPIRNAPDPRAAAEAIQQTITGLFPGA